MIRILQSKWAVAVIGGISFLGTTAFLGVQAYPKLAAIPAAAAPAGIVVPSGPSWSFHNPEIDQLIEELRSERKMLDERKQLLDDLELRLQTERTELTQLQENVRQMREEFDRQILQVQQEEVSNLKKLAKVYAGMDPEGARTIMEQMDDSALVKILLFMKESETAPILESIGKGGEAEAKRAARISDLLRVSAFRTTAAAR